MRESAEVLGDAAVRQADRRALNPRLQVIILSYNRIAWLEQCLRSFLAQTYSAFDLLVLDNNSSEDIEGMVAALGDPRLSCLRNDFNLGGLANFKKACDIASADYFMVFHDDDCAHPRMLEWQTRAAGEEPGAAIVLSRCKIVYDQSAMMDFDQTEEFGLDVYADDYGVFEAGIRGVVTGFGGTLYRTTVVKECRGLLEGLVAHFGLCFDRAWLLALAQKGRAVCVIPPTYNVRCHDRQDSVRLSETYPYSLKLMRHTRQLFDGRWDHSIRGAFEEGVIGLFAAIGIWHIRNRPTRLLRVLADVAQSRIIPAPRLVGRSAALALRWVGRRTLARAKVVAGTGRDRRAGKGVRQGT